LKYKIVVFGAKKSTISLMETFKEDIDLIVTVSDTIKKNNHIAGEGDVSEFAKINNIECYSTEDYSLKSCVDFFQNNEFEMGISYGWQRLIPQYVLDRFKNGVFGTHASPLGLPYGKGRSPLNWSVIRGFNQVYFNLFKYVAKADSGMMYSTVKFEINNWDTIESIKMKDLIVTRIEVYKLINDYKNNTIKLFDQKDDIEETFFPKRSPKDGKINLMYDTIDIYNLIRGTTRPFPGSFLIYDESEVIIWDAVPFDNKLDFSECEVGEVIDFFDGQFILKSSDGTLLVKDFECEKKLKKGIVLK
jgi:UDP-4-amino-4-deoxy-L-arabinose formyltransferase/UDP-glucuronic acid dehydrogenase (UDP-4-keto-hexauronic acid decarboxylating)